MVNETVDSPRTSAGISRSFLTPIRRLGLSRKRRTPGLSPLLSTPQSKIVTLTPPSAAEKPVSEEDGTESPNVTNVIDGTESPNVTSVIDSTTPGRKLGLHRRQNKKLNPERNDCLRASQNSGSLSQNLEKIVECDNLVDGTSDPKYLGQNEDLVNNMVVQPASKLPEKKSLSVDKKVKKTTSCLLFEDKTKIGSEAKTVYASSAATQEKTDVAISIKEDSKVNTPKRNVAVPSRKNSKQNTPKQLRKGKSEILEDLKHKCIVVIDKHVLKQSSNISRNSIASKETLHESSDKLIQESITYDSDHDDAPLSEISKRINIIEENNKKKLRKRSREMVKDLDLSELNLPQELKMPVAKITKFNKDKISTSTTKNCDLKAQEWKMKKIQNIFALSDSEDDDFESKKTILVRKAYPKPLSRAKSTGSITQKDIEDIKARIKNKKNALLIKSSGHNIAELMNLIKKWRQGCQNALMELLDIMRMKIPDKQNMKTGELLQMLNIPMELVYYNTEDDCFLTPEN